jgi:dihydrofolate reductase
VRDLVAVTQLTLDGVMQAPGGPEEDPTGGFAHGGWSVAYFDDVLGEALDEAMARPFDIVLGRKTYEIFAAHWPYADDPVARTLNAATKHVASTTLKRLEWSNSSLIEGDVPAGIARLKRQDGPELHVLGSWDLVQTLIAHELVDEFRLWIFPVLVGPGKRLFAGGTPPAGLRLDEAITTTTGVVIATYRHVGALPTGSYAFEEPTDAEVRRREHLER